MHRESTKCSTEVTRAVYWSWKSLNLPPSVACRLSASSEKHHFIFLLNKIKISLTRYQMKAVLNAFSFAHEPHIINCTPDKPFGATCNRKILWIEFRKLEDSYRNQGIFHSVGEICRWIKTKSGSIGYRCLKNKSYGKKKVSVPGGDLQCSLDFALRQAHRDDYSL